MITLFISTVFETGILSTKMSNLCIGLRKAKQPITICIYPIGDLHINHTLPLLYVCDSRDYVQNFIRMSECKKIVRVTENIGPVSCKKTNQIFKYTVSNMHI